MKKFVLLAAVAALGLTATANAAVYTTEAAFDAANPVSTTEVFTQSGLGPNMGGSYSQGGINFTGINLRLVGTGFWGSVNSLLDDTFNGFIGASFAATDAVGFYFASSFGNGTPINISFLNGASTVFSATPVGGGVSTSFSFFGVDGIGPITGFKLNSAGTGGFASVGPITLASAAPGVPEPAAWAMMLSGFGIAGAAMRRRARVTVTFA